MSGGQSAEGGGGRGVWAHIGVSMRAVLRAVRAVGGLGTSIRLENPNQGQLGGDNGRDRTKGAQGTMAEE